MLKKDIKVNEVYLCNHTSGIVPVRILSEIVRGGYSGRRITHWKATNLKTGRLIEIKSAAKLSPYRGSPINI